MRVLSLLLGVAMATATFPALAEETVAPSPKEAITIAGIGRVDYRFLFEATSLEGESMDAFAQRIGPRIRAYSETTGFEACGVIASDGQRFGAVIGTNESHIACANFHNKVPKGMKSVGQTIHSHGNSNEFSPNDNDRALMGDRLPRRPGVTALGGQKKDAFSTADFQGGAGYLAATDEIVLHQKGSNRTVRRLKR